MISIEIFPLLVAAILALGMLLSSGGLKNIFKLAILASLVAETFYLLSAGLHYYFTGMNSLHIILIGISISVSIFLIALRSWSRERRHQG